MTEEDLDRYNITSLVDAAKMVPNMVIAFTICFFPILLTTVRGMQEVEPELLDLVRALRASRNCGRASPSTCRRSPAATRRTPGRSTGPC